MTQAGPPLVGVVPAHIAGLGSGGRNELFKVIESPPAQISMNWSLASTIRPSSAGRRRALLSPSRSSCSCAWVTNLAYEAALRDRILAHSCHPATVAWPCAGYPWGLFQPEAPDVQPAIFAGPDRCLKGCPCGPEQEHSNWKSSARWAESRSSPPRWWVHLGTGSPDAPTGWRGCGRATRSRRQPDQLHSRCPFRTPQGGLAKSARNGQPDCRRHCAVGNRRSVLGRHRFCVPGALPIPPGCIRER